MKTVIFIVSALLIGVCIKVLATIPKNKTGLDNGTLYQCPNSPNCVSSLPGTKHLVKAIQLSPNDPQAVDKIAKAIETMRDGKILKREPNYIHAEFVSKFMKFKDDVECLYEPSTGLVQIKSASRVGYYDFGVNKQRVERIIEILE